MAPAVEVGDVPSPIGLFRIAYEGAVVRVIDLVEPGAPQSGVPAGAVRRRPPFRAGTPPAVLRDYFRDGHAPLGFEVAPESASSFDRTVWEKLREVPVGKTVTYGELARRAGFPGAARAVGGAMARNPIPIAIPCHRVVGSGGSMQGYGLGLWRKRWLLDHEGAWPLRSRSAEGPRPGGQRTLDAPPRSAVGR
ncbi:MAG TPA: MGMT family protein [Thermoplasmata archaeon]|nr:MGMT family protein [Thermoplasmata archaeon]